MDKLIIRPVDLADAADLVAMYNRPEVARNLIRLPTFTLAMMEERIRKTTSQRYTLVGVIDGRVVGEVTLGHHSHRPRLAHSGSIGLAVHPDFWGRGIATRLMETVLDIADNWLNLRRVDLEVNTDNPAARRVYEKVGFEVEGLKRMHVYGDGRWADSYVMARIR